MRATFSLLLGAFCPRSVPLFRIVSPAPAAADFSKSRRCMVPPVSRLTGGSKGETLPSGGGALRQGIEVGQAVAQTFVGAEEERFNGRDRAVHHARHLDVV